LSEKESSLGINGPKGLIFAIQRFSLYDGPGIRTVIFFKGCPLACKWCANPESQKSHPEIMTLDRKCVKCGECAEVCTQGAITAITVDESGRKLDRRMCNLCMYCAEICPSGSIKTVGRYLTIAQVIDEIEKDQLFYQNSGSGVTLSGGEPLCQWEFVYGLLKESKDKDFHVALEPCGHAPWSIMEKVITHVDLVLL
jgi:pyruvate formate lyase activating enzyme